MKNSKVNTALVWGCAVLVSGLYGHGVLATGSCESVCGSGNAVDLIDTPCMIENFLRNGGGEDPYRHDSIVETKL